MRESGTTSIGPVERRLGVAATVLKRWNELDLTHKEADAILRGLYREKPLPYPKAMLVSFLAKERLEL